MSAMERTTLHATKRHFQYFPCLKNENYLLCSELFKLATEYHTVYYALEKKNFHRSLAILIDLSAYYELKIKHKAASCKHSFTHLSRSGRLARAFGKNNTEELSIIVSEEVPALEFSLMVSVFIISTTPQVISVAGFG